MDSPRFIPPAQALNIINWGLHYAESGLEERLADQLDRIQLAALVVEAIRIRNRDIEHISLLEKRLSEETE